MCQHFIAFVLAFGTVLPGYAAEKWDVVEEGTDRPGGDYKRITKIYKAETCQSECRNDDKKCRSWTYVRRESVCMLKSTVPQKRFNECCASGLQSPPSRPVPIDPG